MKIAIPIQNGLLCAHFGHCSEFTIIDVDDETREIKSSEQLTPPPHEDGVLPAWLTKMGCTHVIAGGMGGRAIMLFRQNGIQVTCGVPPAEPEKIVAAFLTGSLSTDSNPCDDPAFHGSHGGQCHAHDD